MTQYAEIDPDDPTKIRIDVWEKRLQTLYKAVPTAKYRRKEDYWHFNLTWHTCLALRTTFKSSLEQGPNLKAWVENLYYNTIIPAYNLRGEISCDGYPNLYPHQRADVAFLSVAKRAILANGLGSGKSQSVFSTVRRLSELGEDAFPVLIACPNSTKMGWKREIEQVWKGLTVIVVDGTSAQRKKQLSKSAHVYIINWEALRFHSRLKPYGPIALKKCEDCGGMDSSVTVAACETHVKELNEIEFKTAIGDEIHRIKDPSSKMSRAFKAATGDSEFRFGLSGTPLASSPGDLFSILNWLHPESYTSRTDYDSRFLETVPNYYGGRPIVTGIKRETQTEFFAGLDPYLRRMPKELILKFLPPIQHVRRDVEMGAKQKKAYMQMKKKMISELDSGDVITGATALTKLMRMLQFSSAYGEVKYTEHLDEKTDEIIEKAHLKVSEPSCKLDAFMTDLEDFGDESVVVFAQSKQLIDLLAIRMDKAGIGYGMITGDQDAVARQIDMDAFQNGEIKYILCTIQAGGTGITLTKASIAVFLQRSWSMIDNTQAEGRVHRIGSEQHESVRIIDYVSKDTIEESVFEAIAQKTDQLESILRDEDLMRRYIEGVVDE